MKFILPGIPPSKKNSRLIIHNKQGRAFSIPSNEYQNWEKEMSKCLAIAKVPRESNRGPFRLFVKFMVSGKRSWDLSNKLESIQDLLKRCRVIYDDNRFVLWEVGMAWADSDNDHCIVFLTPMGCPGYQDDLFKEI